MSWEQARLRSYMWGLYLSIKGTFSVSISFYEEKTETGKGLGSRKSQQNLTLEILAGSFSPFLCTKLMPTHGSSIFPW